jgi:hypothetical protein
MPKIRTIKPELWEDEKLAKLKRECRLLFIGLLNFCDDAGIIKANPLYIKSRVFPMDDDVTKKVINDWMGQLEQAGIVYQFIYKGEAFYHIRKFSIHQVIDKRWAKYSLPIKEIESLLVLNQEDIMNDVQLQNNEETLIYTDEFPNGIKLKPSSQLNHSGSHESTTSPQGGHGAGKDMERKGKDMDMEGDARGSAVAPPPPPNDDEKLFKAFQEWVLTNTPSVAKMKEPIRLDQYLRLRSDYSKELVKEILEEMHNWKPLTRKNNSAYLTVRRWADKRNGQVTIKPTNELSYREKEGKAILDALG